MFRPIKIAMLGDSLIYGHGLAREDALPAQLERAVRPRALSPNITVLNHGVSGNTTADVLARLDAVLADKPDVVLVSVGSNDSFDYWNNNTSTVERNLDEIVTRLKAAGVTVWLAGVRVSRRLGQRNLVKVAINSVLELFGQPPAWHAQSIQYARRFHAIYPRLARKHRVPLYPDLQAGVRRWQRVDLLHPDARGVAAIVKRLAPFVVRNLGRSDTLDY
jgi:acyl-CoA thioesterase-1